MKKTFRLTVAFDGAAYVGWQRQANGVSVQQQIEEALERLSGQRVTIEGASRTDTGVHAQGMVASLRWSAARFTPAELRRALNALLPADIRVRAVRRAAPDFHARFDAKGKIYRYRILNAAVEDPLRRQVAWFIHGSLNPTAMRRAARYFVGKHDFSSVAANPGYQRASMVRRITRCAVVRRGDELHVEVEGDGFLYKMVRTIVGTLVQAGLGRRLPDSVAALLRAKDRTQAGKTAPAHGLCLMRVRY